MKINFLFYEWQKQPEVENTLPTERGYGVLEAIWLQAWFHIHNEQFFFNLDKSDWLLIDKQCRNKFPVLPT